MYRRISTTLIAGVISGLSISFFLITLDFIVGIHFQIEYSVYALPFIGAILGWTHSFYGRAGKTDTGLILDEVREPIKTLPLQFAPLVYLSTLLTQFGGGSVGREGAAVQISASLCDQVSRKFKLDVSERKTLLIAGISAGFGAAIGTPFSGVLFGFELFGKREIKLRTFVHVLTATTIAFVISKWLPVPHLDLPHFDPQELHRDAGSIAAFILSPILFGLLVRSFFGANYFFKMILARASRHPPLRGFIGGTLLLILFKLFPLASYEGLGIRGILEAFQTPASPWAAPIKLLLTALTLASGFKGGEFIPLFFIGATAGSSLQGLAGLHPTLLASLGCISMFGGAAKTPLACTLLAIELFGLSIAPFALFVVLGTRFLSGKKNLY
jgi:H+/Cl- antiporter ClcA